MSATGDDVFLTGGSGFVGGHVLRALLSAGYRVRALVRPGSQLPALDGCTQVVGDLVRPGDLVPSMEDCRYLVHVAALYSFNPGDRARIWTTNVAGTKGLLEAARIARVERAVVTSSSATVGPVRGGRLPTEQDWASDPNGSDAYHHSKLAQERASLAARVPVSVILPTAPVGPGDWKPTPTGKMIVDFMRGRIFATLEGGLNIVPVEDVAHAHILALQRGQERERYLIGGQNLTLSQLWQRLAAITHRVPPSRRLPYSLAVGMARLDAVRCRLQPEARPVVPLEGVRLGRETMWINGSKAERELGYRSGSVDEALARAVAWFRDNGYAA